MSKQPFLLALVVVFLVAIPVFAQDADLLVTKDGPATFAADSDVTYTIVVNNLGPMDASSVEMKDPLPAGMTFVSVTQPSPFVCSMPQPGTNGTVDCTTATLTAGTSVTFTLVVHVDPLTPPGTFFTNIATVTSPDDPNDENNQGISVGSTPPPPLGDLSVTKNGPGTAAPDSDVTYSITVTNSGPQAATTVSLDDTLPGTMTFVSLTFTGGTPGWNCTAPPMHCTIASFPAGGNSTFTLVGHIPPATPAGTTFVNTANITADNDPTSENNHSSVATVVSAADLSVLKTAPGTVTAGTTMNYVVVLTNNGPNPSEGASFSDTLPTGVTFVSISQDNGPLASCSTPSPGTNGTVSCTELTDLNNGQSAQFTITVTVGSGVANGTVVSNTAIASSTNTDPNGGNNTSTAMTTVTTAADMTISKSGPATVIAGNPITYTITLNNTGPSAAQNAAFSDTLPGTFVSISSVPGFSCTTAGTVNCSTASMAAGATATFTLVMGTSASAPSASLISNTATVSATNESNGANNSSSAATTVTTSADLNITKSGPAAATANSDVTFTITAGNTGPSDAQSVAVNDVLPANMTFVSVNAPGYSCTTPAVGTTGTVNCTRATLAAGASSAITLVAHVAPAAPSGIISNTATISSATTDPNPGNNGSTANVSIGLAADLAVTKTAANAPSVNQIAFAVTVTNSGPSTASTVTLTDATPAGTTFVSESQSSGPAFLCVNPTAGTAGTSTCTIASLASGATATFTFVYQPATVNSVPISNTATAASPTPDPNPANNSATASSSPAAGIPAASPLVLAALAFTLALMAMVILRR